MAGAVRLEVAELGAVVVVLDLDAVEEAASVVEVEAGVAHQAAATAALVAASVDQASDADVVEVDSDQEEQVVGGPPSRTNGRYLSLDYRIKKWEKTS